MTTNTLNSKDLQTPEAKAFFEAINTGLPGLEIKHGDNGLGGKAPWRVRAPLGAVRGKTTMAFEGVGKCPDTALLNLAGQIEAQCVRNNLTLRAEGLGDFQVAGMGRKLSYRKVIA